VVAAHYKNRRSVKLLD